MGWFTRKKSNNTEILVKVIEFDIVAYNNEKGKLYFYLYETEEGNRRCEHKCSINGLSSDFTNIPEYQVKIYPWLKGRDFTDIPSYCEVARESKERHIKLLYNKILG
jgi:hypothetical protein